MPRRRDHAAARNSLAAAARRAAGRALHAGAVAHQREVAAFAAGIAFIALEAGLADPLAALVEHRDRRARHHDRLATADRGEQPVARAMTIAVGGGREEAR